MESPHLTWELINLEQIKRPVPVEALMFLERRFNLMKDYTESVVAWLKRKGDYDSMKWVLINYGDCGKFDPRDVLTSHNEDWNLMRWCWNNTTGDDRKFVETRLARGYQRNDIYKLSFEFRNWVENLDTKIKLCWGETFIDEPELFKLRYPNYDEVPYSMKLGITWRMCVAGNIKIIAWLLKSFPKPTTVTAETIAYKKKIFSQVCTYDDYDLTHLVWESLNLANEHFSPYPSIISNYFAVKQVLKYFPADKIWIIAEGQQSFAILKWEWVDLCCFLRQISATKEEMRQLLLSFPAKRVYNERSNNLIGLIIWSELEQNCSENIFDEILFFVGQHARVQNDVASVEWLVKKNKTRRRMRNTTFVHNVVSEEIMFWIANSAPLSFEDFKTILSAGQFNYDRMMLIYESLTEECKKDVKSITTA